MEIKEVIRQWQAGVSQRGISGAMGLSRTTVSKYIAAARESGLHRSGPTPTEEQLLHLASLNVAGPREPATPTDDVLEPWKDQIYTWLTGDKLLVTRIHELLVQRGCQISYTSVRRFIGRKRWHRQAKTTVRMAETSPGDVAEFDFGRLGLVWDPDTGRRRVAWGMVIVLTYSRHSFLWPMFHQRLSDIIEGLEAAWAFFQGMPRYLVIDNFPAAVAGADPLHPKLTRGFLEYAQHRGFIPDPARVRRPQDKPIVESGVRYCRERFFKGGQFVDLSDLRSQARRWCRDVAGNRVHGTTRRLPLVAFQEEEAQELMPWDGEPYDVPDWKYAKIHPDHHIACHYALYSVPSTQCPPGTKVEVRANSKLVRIYHRGKLIKVHPRKPKGGRSTDYDDYPAEMNTYTTRAPDGIKRQAATLGPSVAAYAARLLDGPVPWAKLRQGQKLLRLGERYTAQRLEAACQKALAVDLLDVRRLERILVEALDDESLPEGTQMPLVPGRFARDGSAFVRAAAKPGHLAHTIRDQER